jgi:uncharacterized protein YndB with AHSA1/START domain
MNNQILSFSRQVQAPPAEAYRAFTNAMILREWLCDVATVVPHPQGRLYLWWNSGYYTAGEFIKVEPKQAVSFTWSGRGEPASTRVEVTFTPREGGTLVSVKHSGLGTGEPWSQTFKEIEEGWNVGLENLVSVLETGEDLRLTRRPMLGVLIGDFNEEKARELDVPVTQGMRLDGVIPGMGAEAAGLEKNDVITSFAGTPILDYSSIPAALQKHKAGEQIEVVYYRGPEKKTTLMELSRRPIPEIPATASDLANAIRSQQEKIENELDQFFEGVSETEASFKPTPVEWSAKEILAHLIQGERYSPFHLAEIINAQERFYDDYGDNVQATIQATVAVYPTIQGLLDELKRCHAEIVALLERLPDEFVLRKGSYWRVAYNYLEAPYHFREHLEQMQVIIQAARQPQTA